MDFRDFCKSLKKKKLLHIYLIHEPNRETETRFFAEKMKKKGLTPHIASDYRRIGLNAVSRAIDETDMSLVLCFDEETVKKCKAQGVKHFHITQGDYK